MWSIKFPGMALSYMARKFFIYDPQFIGTNIDANEFVYLNDKCQFTEFK